MISTIVLFLILLLISYGIAIAGLESKNVNPGGWQFWAIVFGLQFGCNCIDVILDCLREILS